MESLELPECPRCKSRHVNRDGHYTVGDLEVQRFVCKERACGCRFADPHRTKPSLFYNDLPQASCDSLLMSNISQVCESLARGSKNLSITTEVKTVGEINNRLLEYMFKAKKNGNKEKTIAFRIQRLKSLQKKGANLDDPDSVETVLTTEEWKPSIKWHNIQSYRSYTKLMKIPWTKIKCPYESKQQYTPTRVEFEALVSGLGRQTATFVQALGDTGARCGELVKVEYSEVDAANMRIFINKPEKNSRARVVPVHQRTIAMILSLPRTYAPYCFNPNLRTLQTTYARTRDRLVEKLQMPNLSLIHFHSMRRFFADQEYKRSHFNTRKVQAKLGHKHQSSTEKYFGDLDTENCPYETARAETIEQAETLRQEGYELYDTFIENGKTIHLYGRLT